MPFRLVHNTKITIFHQCHIFSLTFYLPAAFYLRHRFNMTLENLMPNKAVPAAGEAVSTEIVTEDQPGAQRPPAGSGVHRCGDSFYLQTWEQRDDIAPGFRLGVVRQLS